MDKKIAKQKSLQYLLILIACMIFFGGIQILSINFSGTGITFKHSFLFYFSLILSYFVYLELIYFSMMYEDLTIKKKISLNEANSNKATSFGIAFLAIFVSWLFIGIIYGTIKFITYIIKDYNKELLIVLGIILALVLVIWMIFKINNNISKKIFGDDYKN